MSCPACGAERSDVRDSRKRNGTTWRRRDCLNCGERYTTYEVSEAEYMALMDRRSRLQRIAGLIVNELLQEMEETS